MTVIAYKDGILAADSLTTHHGTKVAFTSMKVVKSKKGILCGAAGDATWTSAVLRWVMKECRGKIPQGDGHAIIVKPGSKTIEYWDKNGWIDFDVPYYAIGSGMDYAIGAMAAGACATRAVEAAIQHNESCGGVVNYVKR